MRVYEHSADTRGRDRVLCALQEAAADAESLIEQLRDELEKACERIEELEDEILDLKEQLHGNAKSSYLLG